MSYEKQTWVNGEVITADKLNHMENGIESSGGGGGILICHELQYTQLDKTLGEIKQAFANDTMIFVYHPGNKFNSGQEDPIFGYQVGRVMEVYQDSQLSGGGWNVVVTDCRGAQTKQTYHASDDSSYPAWD